MTRTDIHRPSVIKPEDYEFVSFRCNDAGFGSWAFAAAERAALRAHMDATGGVFSSHNHGGSCHVCGAWAMNTVVWYHAETNTYVETGETCAEKMEFASGSAFNVFRSKVKDARERKAGKEKARVLLEDYGIPAAWGIYEIDYKDLPRAKNGFVCYEEGTLRDMVGNLVKYGSLSEKAIAFAKKLIDRIDNRAAIEAARKAEEEAASPAPVTDKRITIEGEILTIKPEEVFGGLRTLIKTTDGWKAWGSLPRALWDCNRGDRVKFDAAFTVSDDDPKFGYFKRPTKAELIEGVAA